MPRIMRNNLDYHSVCLIIIEMVSAYICFVESVEFDLKYNDRFLSAGESLFYG